MILKRMNYDDNGRLETKWLPGVIRAERVYDEGWQSDVLRLVFSGDSPNRDPNDGAIVLRDGEGVYLCNDEGKTVEVLSHLYHPVHDFRRSAAEPSDRS